MIYINNNMSQYKILVEDRQYNDWSLFNSNTLLEVNKLEDIDPINSKLFNADIFEYINNKVNVIHSCVRNTKSIPGVLVLNNKTYGKYSNNRYLYKCIPDDKRLPIFLVPYTDKRSSFSKVETNKYITIKYKNWDNKHPIGVIEQNLGDVNTLDNFYEYQLYCKSLNSSIQGFTRDTSNALKQKTQDEYIKHILHEHPNIENKCDFKNIFTIDSNNAMDYDDAVSIKINDDNTKTICVYISNVTLWMDILNLWDSFSNRISTIYLPDRKRPMLPTILSDCLCSLQENRIRFAFTINIIIQDDKIINIYFNNTAIKVFKNFTYEENDLLNFEPYNQLKETLQKILNNHKYIPKIKNSYDVITYLMILMNHESAKKMYTHKNGIYRSAITTSKVIIPDNLPEDVYKYLYNWNNISGQYIINIPESHELLDLESYLHITSPIRRLVDLLNIIKFQLNENMIILRDSAKNFYDKWTDQLEYINITMRAIRKVQSDCNLLELCTKKASLLNKLFDGYVFDKLIRNDGLYQYIVYLPELKLTSRITTRFEKTNYSCNKFKIYIFIDSDKLKQKIRLQLIE
jgi:exoribonuclease R